MDNSGLRMNPSMEFHIFKHALIIYTVGADV